MRIPFLASTLVLAFAILPAQNNALALTQAGPSDLASVALVPIFNLDQNNHLKVSITNTTKKLKAIKIRLKGSESSMYFNLYLPPKHTWASKLQVSHESKTTYFDQLEHQPCTLGRPEFDEIITSGSLEILEMGEAEYSLLDCQENSDFFSNLTWQKPNSGLLIRANWVSGNMQVPSEYALNPVSFNNWSETALHYAPHEDKPLLDDVNPKQTAWLSQGKLQVLNWNLAPPITPFIAALIHSRALTEYEQSPEMALNTSVVIFNPFQLCTDLKFEETLDQLTPTRLQASRTTCLPVGIIAYNDSQIVTPNIPSVTVLNPMGQIRISSQSVLLRSDEGVVLTGFSSRIYRLTQGLINDRIYSNSIEAKYIR